MIKAHFEEHVDGIQQIAHMSFYGNILSTLIEKGEPKSGEHVLDVGSGPGWLAIRAAKQVGENGKVFGIDITPGMLKSARSNASTEGVSRICQFREGSALDIPFPDNTFDLVVSNFVLHALSEAEKQVAINEFHKVLKFDGRVVICDAVLTENPEEALTEWSKRFPAEERGVIRHLAGHLDEWTLTSAGRLLEMFSRANFKIIKRIIEPEKIMPVLCIVKASKN